MPAPSLKKRIYTGTFIHTPSLTSLSVLEHAAIGVNEDGVIDWIEERVSDERGVEKNVQEAGEEEGVAGETATAENEGRGKGEEKGKEGVVRTVREGSAWSEEEREGAEVEGMGEDGGEGEGFYFPGFVDTHTHAPQLPNAGLFGTSTLLDWLTTYTFPLESSLSSPLTATRIYTRAVASNLRHGTTCAAYYATIHPAATALLADICLSRGQRAFVGKVCMDREDTCPEYYRDASCEAGMRDTKAVVEHIRSRDPRGELVRPIVTPRFAPACTKAMLAELGKMVEEKDLHVQTHISENTGEIALVKKLYPERKSYADVYDHYGLLTDKTVLAHAIHLTEEERELVKVRGAGVSHCPVSNTSLGSGILHVRRLLEMGVEVGLGTDVSGGGSCSILTAAREAAGVSRLLSSFANPEEVDREKIKLQVNECLYLATMGGARVLGLEEKVGALRVGMEWDAQLVRLERVPDDEGGEGVEGNRDGEDRGLVQVWGKETWEEKLAKWMYCGDDRNTRKVWVKGRLVHER